MPASQTVTETIILHLKEGVNLEKIAYSTSASSSAAVQAFIQLTDTVKSQQGLIRQFWIFSLYLALLMRKMRKLKQRKGSSSRRSTHLRLVYR